MRTYELLWRLKTGSLAKGKCDSRLNQDAQLGARLIRSYAGDWLDGGGRFAALCLPYLLEDEAEKAQQVLAALLDTKAPSGSAVPEGLAEIEPGELEGAIHPSEDPDLSGIENDSECEPVDSDGLSKGRSGGPAVKTAKKYRQPFEYAEVMKAAGVNVDERDLVAKYYRERALPHLIPFPTRELPESTDPIPEGLEIWDVGTPVQEIDWLGTLMSSPHVIPGNHDSATASRKQSGWDARDRSHRSVPRRGLLGIHGGPRIRTLVSHSRRRDHCAFRIEVGLEGQSRSVRRAGGDHFDGRFFA